MKLVTVASTALLGALAMASQAAAAIPLWQQHGDSAPWSPQRANLPAAAAVPEPATWAMMLIGIAALGLALRMRHRKAGAL